MNIKRIEIPYKNVVRTHPDKKGAENDWHDGEDKVRQKNGYGEDEARPKKVV